jgi:pantoate--beta-alanine ligase
VKRVTTVEDLRVALAGAREQAGTAGVDGDDVIGFVATMGALHEGHLSLVDAARSQTEFVVMSVFVNPTQFGPGEDFDAYPRHLERDAKLAEDRGVDLLYAPANDDMYPHGEPVVVVTPGPLADRLCGLSRPGHFQGVLTVVAKLFGRVQPDMAVFGQKDFQQAVLVRRMVQDLDMPVRIAVGPIVREEDGLALSSRNRYLSESERGRARSLSQGLFAARSAFEAEEVVNADRLKARVRGTVRDADVEPEYIELVDPLTLDPLDEAGDGAVLAIAARVGDTRLIDNLILGRKA